MKKFNQRTSFFYEKQKNNYKRDYKVDSQIQMSDTSIYLSRCDKSTQRNMLEESQWRNQKIKKRFQEKITQRPININQIKYIQNPQIQKKQLFKERKNNRKQKLSLYSNPNKYQCQICENELFDQQLIRSCFNAHKFCKQCLTEYIQHKIKSNEEITCPKQNCHLLLDSNSTFFKSLPQQALKKWNRIKKYFNILKNPNLRHCPGLNCEGVLKLSELDKCICDLCRKQFCKHCLLETHAGSCDLAQLNYLQDVLKYRQCFKCKYVIEKTQACNHMTCRCGNQFCYRCGISWVANHNCLQTINTAINNPPLIQNNQRLVRQNINPPQTVNTAINNPPLIQNNQRLHRQNINPPIQNRASLPNQSSNAQNQNQRPIQKIKCRQVLKFIFQVFAWTFLIPIWLLLIGAAILILIGISISSILFCGSIAGLFVYLPKICCQSQYKNIMCILTIICYGLPLLIGIIVGIYKISQLILPKTKQFLIKIFEVCVKPIKQLYQF